MDVSGHKLTVAREAKGLSRKDLGDFVGWTYQRIFQVETSESSSINKHVVAAIAKKLGIRTEDLLV